MLYSRVPQSSPNSFMNSILYFIPRFYMNLVISTSISSISVYCFFWSLLAIFTYFKVNYISFFEYLPFPSILIILVVVFICSFKTFTYHFRWLLTFLTDLLWWNFLRSNLFVFLIILISLYYVYLCLWLNIWIWWCGNLLNRWWVFIQKLILKMFSCL